MKKIINGKSYNTDTAEIIASFENGLGSRDFRNYSEELYKTKKGNYFLAGEGGAMTKYSRPVGNMTDGGSDIFVLSKTEAIEWLERHGETEALEKYFADDIEEG